LRIGRRRGIEFERYAEERREERVEWSAKYGAVGRQTGDKGEYGEYADGAFDVLDYWVAVRLYSHSRGGLKGAAMGWYADGIYRFTWGIEMTCEFSIPGDWNWNGTSAD